MEFKLDSDNKNATKEDILNDVKNIVKKHNIKKLTQSTYRQYGGQYSIWMIYDRFESWFNMLEEAELRKTRNLGITEHDLLNNILEVWMKLQRQPKYNDMKEAYSKYSIATYERRFGGWRNALEAFIKYVNNENLSMPKNNDITDNIHKTPRNINQRLRFKVMRRDNFKCKICGKSPANDINIELHCDHIVPWVKGGETVEENLQTLCSKCNLGKSDLDMTLNTDV